MMQQYQGIRRSLPADTLLLFRLGDFYEMFFDDAKEAAGLLNVALTKRNQVPMCGIPYHAAEGYIRRLIKAGRRVAICDQVGEPQKGQIVQREVVQIVSPGTIGDVQMLDAKRNNFLAAIYAGAKGGFGFAFVDLTTGDFRLTELADEKELTDELARVQPAETLVARIRRGNSATSRAASWRGTATPFSWSRPTSPCASTSRCSRSTALAAAKCPRRSARRARFCTT
jgi:DNA mismatch repair protein MutS